MYVLNIPALGLCSRFFCSLIVLCCLFLFAAVLASCATPDLARLNNATFIVGSPEDSVNRHSVAVLAPSEGHQSQKKVGGIDTVQVVDDAFSVFSKSGELPDSLVDSTAMAGKADTISVNLSQSPESPVGVISNTPEAAANVYSLDVVEAPIKAVLYSLAVDAGVELRFQGSIDSSVTVSVSNKPLKSILTLLAAQAGIDWELHDKALTVRGGAAFGDSYSVNYLNMSRRTQSRVGLATQVGTINASNESGSSIANSSQTQIENTSEHHFWESLESDVRSIINGSAASGSIGEPELAVNREAGLLTLFASPDVHRTLKRYLGMLHANTQRQVLIEATVVEVALSENFEAGVDWQLIANGLSGVSAAQVLVGAASVALDTVDRIAAPAGVVSLVQAGRGNDVKATLSLLEQFGDVRILSRPRIIAMNNQASVLKVVDNRVYFTLNVQRRQSEDKDEIITETEIHTVPVGLVMNVTPQISQGGSVMLNVRPTLSRILGFVNDPNPELALANVRNGVPEIQVREMESMLRVQSGDVAIIGGLMQETQSDNNARLPGLGQLPVVGKLFSSKHRERRQTELLIVLRPTVLTSAYTSADGVVETF